MLAAAESALSPESGSLASWRKMAFRVPLLFAAGNLVVAMSLEMLGLMVRRYGGWSWSDHTFSVPLGVGAAQLAMAGLWLSFGRGHPLLMWPVIYLLIALGCLARLAGAYASLAPTYALPIIAFNWPGGYLIAIQFFLVLTLVLVPLRCLSGWELGFEAEQGSRRLPPLQFSLMQILGFTLAVAASLGLIRAVYLLHADTDRLDIFSGHLILFSLTWLSPTLIPLAAAAWMTLAHRRRWIGAMVLVISLLAPGLIVELELARYVDMHARTLWYIHWTNLSAALWLVLNLILLRWCGLKAQFTPELVRKPQALIPLD